VSGADQRDSRDAARLCRSTVSVGPKVIRAAPDAADPSLAVGKGQARDRGIVPRSVSRMIPIVDFWSSVILVVYAYVGYPCALAALAVLRRRVVAKGPIRARVSFIITARNEKRRIREKLENTFAQDYPRALLEILVASDCSSDATDDIVRSYGDRVRLVRAAERKGKEAAQQLAVNAAS